MTIRLADIQDGRTYRMFGYKGRELRPRLVLRYDPTSELDGGTVRACTIVEGRRTSGETYAGSYFIKHAAMTDETASEEASKEG